MTSGDVQAESLYPTARALFREPEGGNSREGSGLRWLAVLAAVGTVFVLGRWILDWADHNL